MTSIKPSIRFRSPPGASTAASTRLIGDPPVQSGKKRLPNKGSWSKGTCPNPNGRPKGAKGVKAITRKVLSEKVTVRGPQGPRKVQLYEGLLRKEVELAAGGDWRARKTVLELGRWALGEAADPAEVLLTGAKSHDELTQTGEAILDLFAEEIRADAANTAQTTGKDV